MTRPEQPFLGILMLDTRFPRIPGDVGNPRTWDFPVRYATVSGATPEAIVCGDMEPFVRAFIAEGRKLVAQGCTGIATTCGFLTLIRPRLKQALGVPVAASALEQGGQVAAMLPSGSRVAVLTISAGSLGAAHLAAAGLQDDTPVHGLEGSGFARSILGNEMTLDVENARCEMVAAGLELVRSQSDVGAIILECTNMAPYAADIARATGCPVYSIHTYLTWFYAALVPPVFGS
tara:strand:+ start:1378 stop:2076 length:699 start_codon:yes stop_codon:yes gene_type:complete